MSFTFITIGLICKLIGFYDLVELPFPRAAKPSLVSNEAVPVPAFLGFAMNAATRGTFNFSDKAVAYSLAGLSP